MLHLQTFGNVDLRSSSGAAVDRLLAQPRATALLVYLLLAPPRGYVRRDTLCALFWPDSDEEHARGALSQALTRIRRAAGPGVIEMRGKSEIRVAPDAVACDVLAFEEAVTAGDHPTVLELYAGPFLDGFHADHMDAFERWAETQRHRLRLLAAESARALTVQHIARGRLAEAGRSAARALTLAPESEAVAAELVRALSDAGHRVGALSLYDSWAAALASDLELEPSDDLRLLARDLRACARPAPMEARHPSTGTESGRRTGASESNGPLSPAESPDPVPPAGAAPSRPSPTPGLRAGRSRRRLHGTVVAMAAVAAIGFGLLLGGWVLVREGVGSPEHHVEATGGVEGGLNRQGWLVIADFQGPSTDPALALAFQTLLIGDLESAGYASVVGGAGALSRHALANVLARMRLPPGTPIDAQVACEIAEREGAAGVLAGRVLPLGDDYVLAATILSGPDCRDVIRASTVTSFEGLSQGVAAVSAELRVRLGESRESIRSSPPLPPITTSYIEALRAVSRYLAAPDLPDDHARGEAELLEAVRIEPDFAFAHFLLAVHYTRWGSYDRAVPHILRAFELRSQLPRMGRLIMEALHQFNIESDPATAIATVETLMADFPAVANEGLLLLAEATWSVGDWERTLDVSLRYLRTGPAGFSARIAYEHASGAAWALGRVDLADSLYAARVRAEAEAGFAPERSMVLLHHLRHRDWAGAEAYCAAHPTWDRCGYLFLARGRLEAAADIFRQRMDADTVTPHPWTYYAASAALVRLELLRGRRDTALAIVERMSRPMPTAALSNPGMHLGRFLLCAAAVDLAGSRRLPECRIEQEDPAEWDAHGSFHGLIRSGAWSRRLLAVRSLEAGDAAAALEHGRQAVRTNFGNPGVADHLIQALALDHQSRPDSALVHYLEATRIERDCCLPTVTAILVPLGPLYRRLAELAEETGDRALALEYYGRFVDLWAEADPELQPQVRAVIDRMNRLRGRELGSNPMELSRGGLPY